MPVTLNLMGWQICLDGNEIASAEHCQSKIYLTGTTQEIISQMISHENHRIKTLQHLVNVLTKEKNE